MILDYTSVNAVSDYGFGEAVESIRRLSKDAFTRIARARVMAEISRVSERQNDWDGFGSERPAELACNRAKFEAVEFVRIAYASDLGWKAPYVSSNECGEVSMEWWNGEKKLTLYIGPSDTHYVCSWGPDVDATMDAGVLPEGGFLEKWRWFNA